ncbi:ABC transporter ATP-binding protein [Hahella sp. CCB-MM4]|uniref:ABC transporter ATP-binding protein n=1 Tax=Hahella sp. (strain CCB-MM4) TaxID=1926491 RepID=UPI000B9B97A4|nr:ABC transporter ATP-binding protein [Hahella sp. CCB-MM4]OZG71822.1 ABC transporter ATP-binding protein [Hahella sp. CCB-MM4]
MSAIVELDGVSKIFHTEDLETHALSNISFSIAKGEYVAIAGPSGCGKSTLLSILGLLDNPSRGRCLINGMETSSLNTKKRAAIRNREIGFVFQSFNLISDLTVEENVMLPLTYRKGLSGSDMRQRVHNALDQVDIVHRGQHYPAQLSGGQQQRVAVARAIVGEPSLILADEPTGNLDSKNAEAVMALLERLHQNGATICMVTHDPRSAARASRRIELFDGRLLDDRSIQAADLVA